MYDSKRRVRNGWLLYSPALQESREDRLRLETQLRRAVDNGEFHLVYQPQVSLRSGYGAWAIQEAYDGSLWVGGDYTYARGQDTRNQWTGAFVRFAPTDATAPAVPQDLTASRSEGTVQLSWKGVDDATYEVLREDRVVATTASVSHSLPALDEPGRYFVRAVDAAGNRSATTPVAGSGPTATRPRPRPTSGPARTSTIRTGPTAPRRWAGGTATWARSSRSRAPSR